MNTQFSINETVIQQCSRIKVRSRVISVSPAGRKVTIETGSVYTRRKDGVYRLKGKVDNFHTISKTQKQLEIERHNDLLIASGLYSF